MNYKFKRIVAAIVDFYIICFLCTAFIGVLTLGKFDITPFSITMYLLLTFLLLLIKDCAFKSASIGKRLLKLELIKTDETKLMIVDTIKRNIPILVLFPIEVILLVVNNKRIGDIWAKTSVVYNEFNTRKK